LHIEQSVAVSDPAATGQLRHQSSPTPPDFQTLTICPYFTLELLTANTQPLTLNTHQTTFHSLTVVAGQLEIECASDEPLTLKRFETVLIPAASGEYQVRPLGAVQVLRASLTV
jgi:hypothetical protein